MSDDKGLVDVEGVPWSKWRAVDRFEFKLARDFPLAFLAMHREHKFIEVADYRFDYAWPSDHVAVEIDGYGPGHRGQKAMARDHQKTNHAQLLGWIVLRFMTSQLRSHEEVDEACAAVWDAICLESFD